MFSSVDTITAFFEVPALSRVSCNTTSILTFINFTISWLLPVLLFRAMHIPLPRCVVVLGLEWDLELLVDRRDGLFRPCRLPTVHPNTSERKPGPPRMLPVQRSTLDGLEKVDKWASTTLDTLEKIDKWGSTTSDAVVRGTVPVLWHD